MTIPIWGDVVKELGGVVREFIPDADKKLELDFKIKELADKADARETELLVGQIETNKEEAKNSNIFVAGWRPFLGWVGGVALAHTWIVAPMLKWVFDLNGIHVPIPALPAESIYPIVLAMLGIGTQRTVEKLNGVATSIGGKVLKRIESVPADQSVVVQDAESAPVVHKKKSRWFN